MRWTALVAKSVVAGAAGAFLAVSAAGVQPPRQASEADPGREVPADERTYAPGPGSGATGPVPSPSPTVSHRSP
ncbi:hypothetical protein [Streptomyces sp. R44]|uniref:Uncharacterized protein n=1 Tax=Streptomyces sp. R44 TaxID=3238633 RepID=A0AB39SM62_9ACTN